MIKSIAKNIFVVISAVVLGSVLNMLLINIGHSIIPLPEGADVSTMEKLRDSMTLFSPVNFIFPFLAHALGTLLGAIIAARFVASHPMMFAMVIGVFFLIGGITAVSMLGGPLWFNATDLLLAYIPMGFLGGKLGEKMRSKNIL